MKVAERKMEFRKNLVEGNLELAEKFWDLARSRRERSAMLAVIDEFTVDAAVGSDDANDKDWQAFLDLNWFGLRLNARYLASQKAKRCRS